MKRKTSSSTKKNIKKPISKVKSPRGPLSQEIQGIFIFAIALIFGVGIYTKQGGLIGRWIHHFFMGIMGIAAYGLPILISIAGMLMLLKKMNNYTRIKMAMSFALLVLVSTFVHSMNLASYSIVGINLWEKIKYFYGRGNWNNGGVIGAALGNFLLKIIGIYGTYILIITLFIIIFILLTGRSFVEGIILISKLLAKQICKIKNLIHSYQKVQEDRSLKRKEKHKIKEENKNISREENTPQDEHVHIEATRDTVEKDKEIKVLDFAQKQEHQKSNKEPIKKETKQNPDVEKSMDNISSGNSPINYKFPSIGLLQLNESTVTSNSKKMMLDNAKKLEKTLSSFGVNAKVLQISMGPAVTRYELQPSQGVKVSKIVNLADDIALNLAAAGIRIEAPIPGKAAVGIEVPNKEAQSVFLREVIEGDEFDKFPSKLAFALGKDIAGNSVVTDIARMPHLLIAGATGSGKSVCINTLITSILYKANPNEVKLLMIDPKVVELSVYNGIPHLMIPVVTDPKKAAGALNWAVQEMTNRYKLFAENNVRDIKGYNNMKKDQTEEDNVETMPQMVIIIDELADLMMSAPGDVEDAICRLAQMARAAGIHLVIATQRPSVDVITGVIKANIPSRLAFAVSSGTDSRTILDMVGAEKLLGKGDMLFYPVGASKPVRIQGAFISDKEVESIVESIKTTGSAEYDEDVLEKITSSGSLPSEGEAVDEFLDQAIEMVIDKEKASISMLQRYLRIGFNRAARIMEEMEQRNIVGPDEGSKPRKVLISKEEFEQIKLDTGQKASNL